MNLNLLSSISQLVRLLLHIAVLPLAARSQLSLFFSLLAGVALLLAG